MTTKRVRFLLLLPFAVLLATSCIQVEVARSIQLTNNERESRGVPPVYNHTTLAAKAQAWADVLASRGRLDHSNLWSGAGSGWRYLGENLAMAGSVEEANTLLMNSPSHRSTMLSGRYSSVGVGVAHAGNRVYVVQVFGG